MKAVIAPDVTKVDPFADLMKSGFEVVADETPRRLLLGTQGRERTGKSDWVFRTAPAPIGYIGLDFGHEGVIHKHAGKRQILAWYKNVPPVGGQQEYLAHWQETESRIKMLVTREGIRTVFLDTGTDIWQLLRLAEFGKLNQVGDVKKLYPVINQAYKSLIRMAYDSEVNLVVSHKVKKMYLTRTVSTQRGTQEQEYWDGHSYERDGFGEGGYLIQAQLEHMFDAERKGSLSDKFGIKVLDCRQNMDIAGTELWGEDCDFKVLAQYVFPDSKESDWV